MDNKLSGEITKVGKLKNLEGLWFQNNKLSGEIKKLDN